jgi:hypothetical protein
MLGFTQSHHGRTMAPVDIGVALMMIIVAGLALASTSPARANYLWSASTFHRL